MAKKRNSSQAPVILLVEDHVPLLRNAAFLLTLSGFEVLTATNGTEALKLLKRHTPAAIISDIDMPTMNGYELLRQVRADRRWQSVPFIFASDKYSHDDFLYGLDLGADEYLPKPYELDDLLLALENAFLQYETQTPKFRLSA